MAYTLTFSEDVRGWTSFKSWEQDGGISLTGDYYTFKNAKLWKHHTNSERGNFYGNFKEASITALLNEQSGSVKSFNTLNYEGSQSKIDENLEDRDYYNLGNKPGWYVGSIITDQQEGSLNEFID